MVSEKARDSSEQPRESLHDLQDAAALEMRLLNDTAAADGRHSVQTAFAKSHAVLDRTIFQRFRNLFKPTDTIRSETTRPTAWLDCLRGIAAILVVFHHWNGHFVENNAAFMAVPSPSLPELSEGAAHGVFSGFYRLPGFKLFLGSGNTMVSVFFMVSGWVLTQSSLRQIHHQALLLEQQDGEAARTPESIQQALEDHRSKMLAGLSSLTLRRGVRIYLPVAFHGLIGMILVVLHFRTHDPYFPQPQDGNFGHHLKTWFLNTLSLLNPFSYRTDMPDLGHRYEWVLWTLPLEFYGSLVCFVMTLCVARATNAVKRRLFIALFAIWAMLVKAWFVSNFLTGMLLADLTLEQYPPFSTNKSVHTSRRASLLGKLTFAAGVYFACAPVQVVAWYSSPGYTWLFNLFSEKSFPRYPQTLGAGLMLAPLAFSPKWQARLANRRFAQWAGRHSFSLYLVHVQLYDSLGRVVHRFFAGTLRMPAKVFLTEPIGSDYDDAMREVVPADWLGEAPRIVLGWLGFMLVMWPILILLVKLHARYFDANVLKFARWLETKFIQRHL